MVYLKLKIEQTPYNYVLSDRSWGFCPHIHRIPYDRISIPIISHSLGFSAPSLYFSNRKRGINFSFIFLRKWNNTTEYKSYSW